MASVMAVAVVLTACGGPPPVPDTKNLDELYQAAKAEGRSSGSRRSRRLR